MEGEEEGAEPCRAEKESIQLFTLVNYDQQQYLYDRTGPDCPEQHVNLSTALPDLMADTFDYAHAVSSMQPYEMQTVHSACDDLACFGSDLHQTNQLSEMFQTLPTIRTRVTVDAHELTGEHCPLETCDELVSETPYFSVDINSNQVPQ